MKCTTYFIVGESAVLYRRFLRRDERRGIHLKRKRLLNRDHRFRKFSNGSRHDRTEQHVNQVLGRFIQYSTLFWIEYPRNAIPPNRATSYSESSVGRKCSVHC